MNMQRENAFCAAGVQITFARENYESPIKARMDGVDLGEVNESLLENIHGENPYYTEDGIIELIDTANRCRPRNSDQVGQCRDCIVRNMLTQK